MKFSIFQNLMAVTIVLLCMHEEDALLLPFNKWVVTASKNLAKGVSIATAVVCICGLPSYSVAEEAPSLKSQLKAIQDVKVASQKLAIETAEQDLQTKELLYPEGRLIGRGIIKLIPESGICCSPRKDNIISPNITSVKFSTPLFATPFDHRRPETVSIRSA